MREPQVPRSVGIIPARGGSKGVPRKNVRPLGGKPLIAYTIEAAHASLLTHVIVSTDDEEITSTARALGCAVLARPHTLATDTTPMIPVLVHALRVLRESGQHFEYSVLLQPTSPLRLSQDIDACLELLHDSGADTVVSVAPVPGHFHPDWQFTVDEDRLRLYNGGSWADLIPRRQLLSATYTRNGAIYACKASLLLENNTLFGTDVRAYIMPEERSANIDTELDFAVAEARLSATPSTRC